MCPNQHPSVSNVYVIGFCPDASYCYINKPKRDELVLDGELVHVNPYKDLKSPFWGPRVRFTSLIFHFLAPRSRYHRKLICLRHFE